ncbi:major facilitator superfamily protein [Pseudoxanthomonas spadix BD-a59]|uniref:Major facilitator superfamily protein n=1 Tax=Pseudoxanthomonas spadix (strain BD-a59) TaxID=1045855 RepID=G7UNQ0_PSEUP|nr:major facilitator superfamily protein [Pseudoxanthomonas spadix BD-a59]
MLSGIGFLISALGAWLLMGLSADGSLWAMAIPMLLIGIGNGLPWGLMDALSVSVVPKERAGMAAGIFTTMRVAGEAIAIAVIGAVLVGLTAANLRAAAKTASLSLPQSATAIASQIGASAEHSSSVDPISTIDGAVIELAHHAYTSAFHGIFAVLAVLSVLTAVVCILTLRRSADQ